MQSLDMEFDTCSDAEGDDRALLPAREVPPASFWSKLRSPTKPDDADAAAVPGAALLGRFGHQLCGRLRARDQAVLAAVALGVSCWAGLALLVWLVGAVGRWLQPAYPSAPPLPTPAAESGSSGGDGWESRGAPSPAPSWLDREDPGLFGGGWQLVRCVGSHRAAWHPATDGLMGTDAYGTFVPSYLTDTTFSTTWDVIHTNEYLFATSDLVQWLACDKATVFVQGNPTMAAVKASSKSNMPYKVKWIVRGKQYPEDPWVSVENHNAATPGVLYAEDSTTGNLPTDARGDPVGACVWIR